MVFQGCLGLMDMGKLPSACPVEVLHVKQTTCHFPHGLQSLVGLVPLHEAGPGLLRALSRRSEMPYADAMLSSRDAMLSATAT